MVRGLRAVAPAGVGTDLGRRAEAGVRFMRLGQPAQLDFFRRRLKANEVNIDQLLPGLAAWGDARDILVVEAERAGDAVRFAAIQRGQDALT